MARDRGFPTQRFRGIILVLALLEGGWSAFDGGRALVVGDYVTPHSGDLAGQLGQWAQVRRRLVACALAGGDLRSAVAGSRRDPHDPLAEGGFE
jgi:hypothetical protein